MTDPMNVRLGHPAPHIDSIDIDLQTLAKLAHWGLAQMQVPLLDMIEDRRWKERAASIRLRHESRNGSLTCTGATLLLSRVYINAQGYPDNPPVGFIWPDDQGPYRAKKAKAKAKPVDLDFCREDACRFLISQAGYRCPRRSCPHKKPKPKRPLVKKRAAPEEQPKKKIKRERLDD